MSLSQPVSRNETLLVDTAAFGPWSDGSGDQQDTDATRHEPE